MKALVGAAVLTFVAVSCLADAVKDREGAVRNDRAAMEKDSRWIYNDFQRGLERAKWSGKPLLAVLRCVPCLSCAGIDASVLGDPSLAPLLDQFVCVRIINANALDLTLFQFDYDLSLSALMFNGDGTIYGRFGSWTHQKNPQDKTTAGFRRALEGALALHREYPGNKAALAGKQGGPTPFQKPTEFPALAGKYKPALDWEGKVVPSCVHCHQIGEAYRELFRTQKKPIPAELIYPMPSPETIGLSLGADHAARVENVSGGSVAAAAGIKAGDEIVSIFGQPLISVADFAWALHGAPGSGEVRVSIRRDGREMPVTLKLPRDWRMKSDISRRVGTWQMRAMATGGLVLEDLPDEERSALRLPTKSMALRVKHVGEYGQHAAAKRAGFRKGDVLTAVGDFNTRLSEGELIGLLLQKHVKGQTVKAAVQRGEQRLELLLPMQ